MTNKNHAQYRAAFVHIHSPYVLFLSRQGIVCHFHFKAGEERQRALLYNHRALKLYPSLNTNNGEILEGAFVVSWYVAPLHRAINITGSKHMIYDMFCLGHFCASLQPSLYARHHLFQMSNKTLHLMLLSLAQLRNYLLSPFRSMASQPRKEINGVRRLINLNCSSRIHNLTLRGNACCLDWGYNICHILILRNS